jgi:serine/threonine-protein kinase RsbW
VARPRRTTRHLALPAVAASLDPIHSLLASLWQDRPDIPADVRMRFETALMEIANNIIEHADTRPPVEPLPVIDLSVTAMPGQLKADITDTGEPADIDLASVSMPDVFAEIGRGLALAQALVDGLTYERKGAANQWSLTLNYPEPAD